MYPSFEFASVGASTGLVDSGIGTCWDRFELRSFHIGHFFASGESSGTSTTSLKQIALKSSEECKLTHTTSSPANLYLFSIFTILVEMGCVSGGFVLDMEA